MDLANLDLLAFINSLPESVKWIVGSLLAMCGGASALSAVLPIPAKEGTLYSKFWKVVNALGANFLNAANKKKPPQE